jgi:hypothetical protein
MRIRNLQQRNEALEEQKMENAQKSTILWVYRAHPDFLICEANDKAIVEAVRDWIQDPDVLPTSSLFEDALAADPGLINRFARQPVERTKEHVRDEILDLLREHSRRDEAMIASEKSRMASWSLDALRSRLEELRFKIANVGTSTSSLKKYVASSRPTPEVRALPSKFTADAIKAMPSGEIRKLVRDYTASVVNARLMGRN